MNHTGMSVAALRLNRRFRYLPDGPFGLAPRELDDTGSARVRHPRAEWRDEGAGVRARRADGPDDLLTVIGGGLADRIKRSTVLFWSNSISGLSQLGIASVLFSDLSIYWVVPLACVNGTAEAFTTPALRGALADIVDVEQLTRANSLAQARGDDDLQRVTDQERQHADGQRLATAACRSRAISHGTPTA